MPIGKKGGEDDLEQGLPSYASASSKTKAGCKKCGYPGHLTFECRNFVQLDPVKSVVLDVSSTSSDSDDEYLTPLTSLRTKELEKKRKDKKKKAKNRKNANEDIHQAVIPTKVNIRKRRGRKRRKSVKSEKRKRKNVPDILPVPVQLLRDHRHDFNFDILESNVRHFRCLWLNSSTSSELSSIIKSGFQSLPNNSRTIEMSKFVKTNVDTKISSN